MRKPRSSLPRKVDADELDAMKAAVIMSVQFGMSARARRMILRSRAFILEGDDGRSE